jgi:general stress protein 26
MVESHDRFHELLRNFGVAMFVTRTTEGELRGRPMAIADVEPDGTVWLLTDRHSSKVDEIEHDSHVNLTMQSTFKFVSLSGKATPVDNRAKIASLWKEAWKVWFPGGKDDPDLFLIQIHGSSGEYWDNSGLSGVRYLIEAGKAYFKGTRPDLTGDTKMHSKVDM